MRTPTLVPGGIMLAAAAIHAIDWAKTTQDGVAPLRSAASTSCASAPLGEAGGFNLFATGDVVQSGTDTEGRVAAGGGVTLTNYSVGARLPAAATPVDALISGASLTFDGGSVNGNVVSTEDATLSHISFGDGGTYRRGRVLDFAVAAARLSEMSRFYSTLPPTGVTSAAYGNLTLTGSGADLNVFRLSAAELSGIHSLSIDAPAGSTVLVNISNPSVALGPIGFALTGVTRDRVLLNAPDATALSLDGLGLPASVLAPSARTTFTNGVILGQLVTGSLRGNGQFNNVPFAGCLPAAP